VSFNPNEPRVPSGQAGGGRWGGGGSGSKANAPRDAAAAKVQKNPKAARLFDKATGLPPKDRAKYMQGLSDADLELLTEALYSARTSDPTIVQSRIAVANEMGKRGLDIKKYGALGGGTAAKGAPRKVTPAQRAAVAHVQARKAAATPAASPAATRPAASAPGRRAI
jgi:hypothetical protein